MVLKGFHSSIIVTHATGVIMFADTTEQTTAQCLYLVLSLVCICYETCSDPENTFACHFLLFMKGDFKDCVFILVSIAWPTSFMLSLFENFGLLETSVFLKTI